MAINGFLLLLSPVQSPYSFKPNINVYIVKIVPLYAILKKHYFDVIQCVYSVCEKTMLSCFCLYSTERWFCLRGY